MNTQKRKLIIASAISVIVGGILLVVGLSISGFDWVAWFHSKWFYLFAIIGGIYVLIFLFIVIQDKIKRL